MFAGFIRKRHRCRTAALLLSLWLAAGLAPAQSQADLDQRVAAIREVNRYVPHEALRMLIKLEPQGRAAAPATKAEFLNQLSQATLSVGGKAPALALAEELIALGKQHKDNAILAKGMLARAYVLFAMNELRASHLAAWEAEKLANTTGDMALRITASITSGHSHEEEGNFPEALIKLQSAATLARQYAHPIETVMALNALAVLYTSMKEFDKGFEALEEALPVAALTNSPGRMATLKKTESALAIETNQPKRALAALLAGLELERKIGANRMIAVSLVNLADSYLKEHDWARTVSYANQAIEAARPLNEESIEATARVNLGQAYLGMNRLADGKRSFEAGLAVFEKSGNKPKLQVVMMEYGEALERAGDMAGAVKAYHRERTISDELFEVRRQKAVLELQGKYEADKKERQIELLRRENEVKSVEIDNRRLQQRVWWLLAVVFALASAIVGILYRKVRQANAQLKVKNLELKQQSSRDPLTSLYNRRHFHEFMRANLPVEKRGAAQAEEIVGALFLLDVDHFKHVNDTYGHAAGDAVLTMISENLRLILRETDMIVRWGGEEFLAFLPAIPRNGVDEIARRLLAGISAQTIEYQGQRISVNVSIGFAPFPLSPGEHPLPWERAVNLVDMALYMAKGHGRNRAYGVRGFAKFGETSMERIEQDLERAWREGFVDMSVVLGEWPQAVAAPAAAANA
ncbi:GGDEF domain-containing protein [Massilia eurypsychrophila]|jgi:diguanylate cyclase (GGDEF)-like protein|uniref:diguanylate cyclase n=1 Tax=Massilia eurypsychrophila TaxID=1485217 RepID=A0A2G8TET7_9BURK|nr:tetratricopeptide repeat-containing diguanylate cyclase [Massilia eurypsychrophila]PIL44565.1 GGDEF domain-containing protein [Massilia eurypsychrophila]